MDMGADVCSGAVCRGAQLPVAADACSAGVRCVGDYDSRPSVCHADTSGSVPAAPIQSRESIVGDGAYCRGLSRRFLRLPVVSRSQFVRSCLIFDIAVCQPKLSLFIFAWAVLNSYSRVYLGVHYPGDLLVGAIIGTAAGLAMAFAAGYVADRVDRPHLKPSVNTGVVTSVGAFTVAVIAVVSCFVRM